MTGKNDFGAAHWSSEKVWARRKKRDRRAEVINAMRLCTRFGGSEPLDTLVSRIMVILDIRIEEIHPGEFRTCRLPKSGEAETMQLTKTEDKETTTTTAAQAAGIQGS